MKHAASMSPARTTVRAAVAVLMWLLVGEAACAQAAPDAITGFWRTEDGTAIIHIAPFEQQYRGRLVWLREDRYPADDPQGMGGERVIDRHNTDPALRDRPLIGLPLLTGLTYTPDEDRAQWLNGRVYDSENGKSYNCDVWLADADHLKLRGYIGIELLGRTTTWQRVSNPAEQPPDRIDS